MEMTGCGRLGKLRANYGNQPVVHQIIALVLYVMSPDGSYINWLSVTNKPFSTKFYGKKVSDNFFRSMGLGTFFLLMVQMQAACLSYNIVLYLQSSNFSYAYQWYKNYEFGLVPNNDLMDLPYTIRQGCHIAIKILFYTFCSFCYNWCLE